MSHGLTLEAYDIRTMEEIVTLVHYPSGCMSGFRINKKTNIIDQSEGKLIQ